MMDSTLEDFRAAATALIDATIIAADIDRVTHQQIRRNLSALNAWFADRTGWRIQDHAEFIRLVKTPARAEPAHALAWARDRRDYELLVWVLWYGEQTGGRRFIISQMAEEIRLRSGDDGAEFAFDWLRHAERRRLVRVLDALLAMGIIRIMDGSLDEWDQEEGRRDALCEWGAAAWQLHVPFRPELLERLAAGELTVVPEPEVVPPSPRMRLYRHLLLGAACFQHDDPEALAELLRDPEMTRTIAADLLNHTGWELELTPAYARLLRLPGEAEAVRPPIPADSSLGHVVLLLCAALRAERERGALAPLGGDWFTISRAALELLISELQDAHGEGWRKEYRTQAAEWVAEEIVPEMVRWGLLRGPDQDGLLQITPLVARLAGIYVDQPTDMGVEDAG
jgi:uncharacterized protein (TIGR02678 family)